MNKKLAVIGGSGIYKLDGIKLVGQKEVETPFGHPSAAVMEMEVEGASFYFLPSHGIGHHTSPSEVNYRANIYALKSLGVDTIVSISAVGSLQEQYAPRDFVLPDQFIDWTKGLRKRTFFDEGMVGHVSTAYPIEKSLQARIYEICSEAKVKTHLGGSYVCIEGPQFSSRAESQIYRSFGASIIGMTNVPEAYLAKEAGIAYATIAMVTDYDCWKDEHCEVSEIMNIMKDNYVSAQRVVTKLIPSLVKNPISFNPENKYAVITDPSKLNERHKKILEVVLK
jgi:5'-methylthioadenosine phosphorylase